MTSRDRQALLPRTIGLWLYADIISELIESATSVIWELNWSNKCVTLVCWVQWTTHCYTNLSQHRLTPEWFHWRLFFFQIFCSSVLCLGCQQ